MAASHGGFRARRDLTPAEIAEVGRLRDGGARWQDVAVALGASRDWAIKASERAGVFVPRGGKAPAPEREGASDARVDQGALRPMHPISLAVLREAGLVIDGPG